MPSQALKDELQSAKAEMNMTPMIDVVFQLIIFFMLLMDMSQQELATLILPEALTSRPDKEDVPDRLVLNVTFPADELDKPASARNGANYEYRIAGSLIRADALPDRLKRHGMRKMDPEGKLSEMSVLVRCDQHIHYKGVIKALVECMNARIWKIELAIREPEKKK